MYPGELGPDWTVREHALMVRSSAPRMPVETMR
jgi:hypothetical protein